MNFLNKKLLSTLALSCLLPISIQSAQASSAYSNSAIFNVTVSGLSNLTTADDFSDLSHSWTTFSNDYEDLFPTGDAIYNSSYTNNAPIASPLSIGGIFSQSFVASGSVGNGDLSAYYESSSELGFSNDSTTDTFQIELTIDYDLSSSATSDLAFPTDLADSDTYLDFSNEDESFFGDASTYASAFTTTSSGANDTLTLTLLLTPGDFDTLYTFSSISGTLQASPVPAPAALWLFGSAIISLSGIRKQQKKA